MVCYRRYGKRNIFLMYELTDDNFFIFAMKHYDNPSCKGMDEFKDDLKSLISLSSCSENGVGDFFTSEGDGTFFLLIAITFIVYIYIYVKLKNIKDF